MLFPAAAQGERGFEGGKAVVANRVGIRCGMLAACSLLALQLLLGGERAQWAPYLEALMWEGTV